MIAGISAGALSGMNPELRFLASGMLGGTSSVMMGGEYGHGFISAGLGGLGGGGDPSMGGLVTSAVVGGTVSVMTGGKFGNGAQSAAFAYAMQWGASKIAGGGGGAGGDAIGPNSGDDVAETEENAQKGAKKVVKDQIPEPGDVVRDHIQDTRDDAGRNFNAQRGDASVYPAQTNCQIIRDCVARLDTYEQALSLDQAAGKDPRVQVIGELLREVSKYSLCGSMNSCDLMQYYNRGEQPPPLWPPPLPDVIIPNLSVKTDSIILKD